MEIFRKGKKQEALVPKGKRELPLEVARARYNEDTSTLRAMGRKGAKRAAENRSNNAAEKDFWAEKAAKEELERRMAANEHILPIDPDEPEK
ncbi:MAG TPA: hypothetical protein VMU13_01375 [Candidatus Paceibacterota bacterium]|nr:hypothetical protein [Candidatus Paceibacterota bacterium]